MNADGGAAVPAPPLLLLRRSSGMKPLFVTLFLAATLFSTALSGVMAGTPDLDPLVTGLLQTAPWLEHRLKLYQHRLECENPAESVRKALLAEVTAPLPAGRSLAGAGLLSAASGPVFGAMTEAYDPFVKVPQTDSLASSANLAVSTVSNRILVVWQDHRSGLDNPDIYAQLFDLTYTPVGVNIKVNPPGIKAAQIAPDLCALSDGRFLVCWEDYTGPAPQIMARLVQADGSLPAPAVTVSPLAETPQLFPKTESWGDSTHVVWLQKDGGDYNIYMRTLSLAALPQAPAIKVNDDENSLQWIPEIGVYSSGQTAVVWEDKRAGDSEIYAQIFKADGVKRGDNFVVNADASRSLQWRPAVAGNENLLQIVWEDTRDKSAAIYTQQFDRWGLPSGDNLRLDQPELSAAREKPSLFVDDQGQRVFAWQEKSGEAWRLKFALFPAASDLPIYHTLGESDSAHEFTDIKLHHLKNTVFFAFLGMPPGGRSTVLGHRVNFTTVPVELVRFTAAARYPEVVLTWRTASETSNLGFEVERKGEAGGFESIEFVPGMGTSAMGQEYLYEDRGLMPGRYFYRLRQVDLDGSASLSGEIAVVLAGPDRFELPAAWPNPFSLSTQLRLRLPESAGVALSVFNLLGRRVRRIDAGRLAAGEHLLCWDGRDDAGVPLPPGEYLMQARVAGKAEVRRVTLIR